MITKENILIDLINFSNSQKPLDTNYFYKKYIKTDLLFTDFDNLLSEHIHDLQCDQIDAAVASKPYYLIFENDLGYYISKTRDEALSGNQYYLSKVKSILSIMSNYTKMIANSCPDVDPQQLDLL